MPRVDDEDEDLDLGNDPDEKDDVGEVDRSDEDDEGSDVERLEDADEADTEEQEKEEPEKPKRSDRKRRHDQKRWQRLTRANREKEARIAALERELQEARSQPREAPDASEAVLSARIETMEAKRSELLRQRSAARAQMDEAEEFKVQDELDELNFQLRLSRYARDEKAARKAQESPAPAKLDAPPAPQPHPQPANNRLTEWVKETRFNEWGEAERQIAINIDRSLAEEGYDRNDDEFFEELADRVAAAIPSVRKLVGRARGKLLPQKEAPIARPVVTRPSTPSTSDDGGVARATTKLTPAELRQMERINLDPNSEAARSAFKRALENHR